MKKLVILGAGTAGTMAANRLSRILNTSEWEITLVDPNPVHYYQPGFLFIPFGVYQEKDAVKPKKAFIPRNGKLLQTAVEEILPSQNKVRLANGETLSYDYLIIATGTDIHPEETPGLAEHEWGKSIHTFYSLEGSVALAGALRNWKGGRLVVNVVENPIKCPVAPLEFLFLADWYFTQRGMRDRVELIYATPLPGAFTKPIASRMLGDMLEKRRIQVEPEFMLMEVNPDAKKLVSYDEREVEYDLLVSIPLNKGAEVIGRSGLGDELNYVPTNKHTLLAEGYDNIFVLGDATNVPASKAGATAHYEVDTLAENFPRYIQGKELEPLFDGHANCFIETGYGKGMLIDFNYETEPLPGMYPLPVVGPMPLLKESFINHWGKLGFRWMYWNILMKGLPIPFLPAQMSMVGKQKVIQ